MRTKAWIKALYIALVGLVIFTGVLMIVQGMAGAQGAAVMSL